jgi:hypothetical protein
MAQAVVDPLEPVDVQEHHGQPVGVADALGQAFEEVAPVREPGQGVHVGRRQQRPLAGRPLDGQGGEVRRPLHRFDLGPDGGMGTGAVDGERAQHLSGGVHERLRPDRPEAVLGRQRGERLGERVLQGVVHDDRLPPEGGGATRAGAVGDGHAVEGGGDGVGEGGSRRVAQDEVAGVDEEHRAPAVGVELLDLSAQPGKGLVQRLVAGDAPQDRLLAGQTHLSVSPAIIGQAAKGDVLAEPVDANELAAGVQCRLGPRVQHTDLAVRPDDPTLELGRLAGLDASTDRGHGQLQVVGVDQPSEAVEVGRPRVGVDPEDPVHLVGPGEGLGRLLPQPRPEMGQALGVGQPGLAGPEGRPQLLLGVRHRGPLRRPKSWPDRRRCPVRRRAVTDGDRPRWPLVPGPPAVPVGALLGRLHRRRTLVRPLVGSDPPPCTNSPYAG